MRFNIISIIQATAKIINGKLIPFILIILVTLMTSCHQKQPGSMEPAVSSQQVYYTCSMHPQVRASAPGKCPICGMHLIEVKEDASNEENAIALTDQQISLGNIQVDSAIQSGIGDKTYLTATLNFNQNQSTSISVRMMGRIEKLYFKNNGDYVKKGDPLFELYSDDLNNLKQEYQLAKSQTLRLQTDSAGYHALVQAAKNRLLLVGLDEIQINEIGDTHPINPRTVFYSPVSGYITDIKIKEGDYAAEGATLYQLSNLSTLWAEAQVYTSQLASLDRHGKVLVQIPDMPADLFEGKIEELNPEINPDTRIDLLRVTIPNTGGRLKPGMPAYVIVSSKNHPSITLPFDAVLREGNHSMVWVMTSHNRFELRMVSTGIETDNRVEILFGLKKGDMVVTNGAYLLNSEYKFKKGRDPMAGMKM